MVLQNAVHNEFSRQIRRLERFADNSNTSWNQTTIFDPDRITEVPRVYLLSPCVPALSVIPFVSD